MSPRLTFILAAAAGIASPAVGQELVQVSFSWLETMGTGGGTPVTNPNSVVDPGETARLSIHLLALVNGTGAIGQTTTYSPPPPPGIGTIRGIGSMLVNVRGTDGDATGGWLARSVAASLSLNAFTGTVVDNGATVEGIQGAQNLSPGQTALSANPINNAFRGYWHPNSYTPRTVPFRVDTDNLGASAGVSLAVQYGSALLDPTDPTTEYALYTLKNIPIDDGGGLAIQIAPAPASAAPWLGAALLMATRRRRPP